jgi:hypothetical protein
MASFLFYMILIDMKAFIKKLLREAITLDIKVGDTLMGGKFYNKKTIVKTIEKDDKGGYLINGKPLLRFRIINKDETE